MMKISQVILYVKDSHILIKNGLELPFWKLTFWLAVISSNASRASSNAEYVEYHAAMQGLILL